MRFARLFSVFLLSLSLGSCSKLGLGPAASPLIDDIKGPYLAARGIEASLAAGVTHQDFSAQVRELSKEIYVATDRAKYAGSSDARVPHLLEGYRHLLEMYHDSDKVWSLQDENYSSRNPYPADYGEQVSAIAQKYGFPCKPVEGFVCNKESIRRTIWSQASTLQERLSAESYGQTRPLAAAKQDK